MAPGRSCCEPNVWPIRCPIRPARWRLSSSLNRWTTRQDFVRSIGFLADNVRCRWLKFIVLDERVAPRLAELASPHGRIGVQTFWCSPQELRTRLDAMLAAQGTSSSPQTRRVLAMVAAVASANKDYPQAIALQQGLLHQADAGGSPAEQAMAAYGLGNTLLGAGQAEAAAETFMRACQLCSEHGLNELAPMAYTNLGVSLHRLERLRSGLRGAARRQHVLSCPRQSTGRSVRLR